MNQSFGSPWSGAYGSGADSSDNDDSLNESDTEDFDSSVHTPAARAASSKKWDFLQGNTVGVALYVSFTYHINPMPIVHASEHAPCGGPFGPHSPRTSTGRKRGTHAPDAAPARHITTRTPQM